MDGKETKKDEAESKEDGGGHDFRDHDNYRIEKNHVLCLIGSDMQRHYGEWEIFNLLYKHLKPHLNPEAFPLESIYKKKGKGFAFLNFTSKDQMKDFMTPFTKK